MFRPPSFVSSAASHLYPQRAHSRRKFPYPARLQLAELLLEHYPAGKADALEHLDFAIKEFREMKMQPSLDRAMNLVSDLDNP